VQNEEGHLVEMLKGTPQTAAKNKKEGVGEEEMAEVGKSSSMGSIFQVGKSVG